MLCSDSSIIIAILSQRGPFEKIISFIEDKEFCTNSIVLHEILAGIRKNEKRLTEEFFKEIPILSYNEETAENSAIIEKNLRKTGSMINKADILIAGICITHNLTLVTKDKDFLKIPLLKVKIFEN